METIEEYLDRKADELSLLHDCLKSPLSLPSPRSVAEVIQQKFQLAAALRAEYALHDWSGTETAWARARHRNGCFQFAYDYQRADLDVRGPSFYDVIAHRADQTIFTSCGMAAISALLFGLAKLIDEAVILLSPGSYAETSELIEGYTSHLRPVIHDSALNLAIKRSFPCQMMLIDSAASASTFEKTLRLSHPVTDLLIFDTTCFSATSGRIRRVINWSKRWRLPMVMVRSHTKLDSLGAEYGRLGSAVFVEWDNTDQRETRFHSLPTEMRNALRLLGGAALPAHFPPFVGTSKYRELTKKRMGAILRNSRRAAQFFSDALPGLTAQLRFAHGLYITLKSSKTLSEETAREAAAFLSEDLGRAGLPIRHAGSFGFDFAATEWLRDQVNDQYVVRLAIPDLPSAIWNELIGAVADWWLAREGKGGR